MAHSWGVASEHIVEEVHKVAQDLVSGGGARVGRVGGVRGWEGGSRVQGLPGLGYQYDWWLRECLCNIQKVIRTLQTKNPKVIRTMQKESPKVIRAVQKESPKMHCTDL
jgi:hypothetical protein